MAVESKSCALSRSSSHLWWFRTADSAFCEGGVYRDAVIIVRLEQPGGGQEAGGGREGGGAVARACLSIEAFLLTYLLTVTSVLASQDGARARRTGVMEVLLVGALGTSRGSVRSRSGCSLWSYRQRPHRRHLRGGAAHSITKVVVKDECSGVGGAADARYER